MENIYIGKQVYCHNTWWAYEKVVDIDGIPCARLVDAQGNPIYISVACQHWFIQEVR